MQTTLKNGRVAEAVISLDADGNIGSPGNITTKFREAFEAYDPVNGLKWAESKAAGDLIFVDGNAAAASYLVISKDPLTPNSESSITSLATFGMPIEMSLGVSMSQRTLGQEFSLELVGTSDPLPNVDDIEISAISQTTTVLTVDTVLPHGLSVGKSIGIRDCSNQLVNYPALVVASVPSPTQFTATAGPGGTIVSQTVTNPAGAKGFVFFRERFGRARNGISQIFENTNTSNASLYVRSDSGDALPSGTVGGNHSVTVGTTIGTQLVNSAYQYAFASATEYRIFSQADRTQWVDSPVDSLAQTSSRLLRTQVCPSISEAYAFRVRATNNKSLTVPHAQIVSAVKTGTTTATITCDRPHNLVTNDLVVIYGIRDQGAAGFPNLTTATAVTVVDATSFTVVIGTAFTVTSAGGYVAKVQGGNLMSSLGAVAQVPQSAVLSTLADGTRQLTLTGNANWAAPAANIGDMLELVGCRADPGGVSLGVDGPWKIASVSTTTLVLVLPFANQRALPADFGSTNCGGGVIRRTCLRLSFIRIFDYERERVELLGRAVGDLASAAPVSVQGGSVAVSTLPALAAGSNLIGNVGGSAAHDAAISGNPVRTGGRAITANYTAVAAGDAADYITTTVGAQVTKPYAIPEAGWNASLSLTTTTAAPIQAAAGAGLKRHVTALQAINTGAAAVDLIILDGVTERWRLPLPVNVPVTFELPTEIVTTANTALNANLSAAGTVRANFQGYTAP